MQNLNLKLHVVASTFKERLSRGTATNVEYVVKLQLWKTLGYQSCPAAGGALQTIRERTAYPRLSKDTDD